jgi:hypothetical protein
MSRLAGVFEQRSWLARVWSGGNSQSQIVGTAFAVDNQHLLTCAHVVMGAGVNGPGQQVSVDFPLLGKRSRALVIEDGWRPVPRDGDSQSAGDVAVLRLDDASLALDPLPLRRRESYKGLSFSSYGFPISNPESDAAHGRLGLRVGQDWVRLEADSAAVVEPGFSGAPVWADDLGGAVAMILTRKQGDGRIAYAMPLGVIAGFSSIVAAALSGPADPLAWLDRIPSNLAADVLSFSSVIEERTQDFVGREFVFAALDRRLNDPKFPAGYILIRGEPGIGKSAIMAQIARTHGYAHHFNIARDNVRSPELFLRNACAQLITRYELPRDNLPSGAGESPEALKTLLAEAVERSSERGEQRVVLLVDALDEAEEPARGVNRLFLPGRLPPGCYVIATIRDRVDPHLDSEQRADDIVLEEKTSDNERDVRKYIGTFVERHRDVMKIRLAQWQATEEKFIGMVWDKSEGNFMYLRHVLPEIVRPERSEQFLGKMDELPSGLFNYYSRHWNLMRDRDLARFRRLQRPILCVLAKARQAVAAGIVAEWINESGSFQHVETDEVEDVLAEWAEFLHEEPGDPPRLRLYHNTFLEFLEREVKLDRYARAIATAMAGKVEWDAQ